ncbi:MAG: hypothetical protein DA408_17355 [Bacteroidetes bacterium]|nr:MAG: hypothetical protein DA408_17355 [Bacteroidota bacterium]
MKLSNILSWGTLAALAVVLAACDPELYDENALGLPPAPEDVTFAYTYDVDNPNIVYFTNTSEGSFIAKWDLGNGSSSEGKEVTGAYPLRGDYTVTLTIYTSTGSASNSQVVNIAETNAAMLNTPEFLLLTGGPDQLEGKTWVIDSTRVGHMGVGPAGSLTPEYWQAPPLDKVGLGLYDDEMTFKLINFAYDLNNHGNMFVNGAHAADVGGIAGGGDQKVNYNPPANMNWSLVNQNGTLVLNISNGGTIGFYTGVSTYQVLTLEENELFIRFLDSKNPDLAWYHRLIPKGYTPPPPPDLGTRLPVNFETAAPTFDAFGGSSYAVIDNPDPSGINTSNKVGQTVHGFEPWAGIVTGLEDPLDFSVRNAFKMKVWSPVTGVAKFKIESSANPNVNIEVDVDMTTTNQWDELVFDFAGAESGVYDRIALFFDFGGPEGNTFYFDDIEQVAVAPALSAAVLTGGGTKAWRLKPVAGALSVGPARGSGEWFAVSAGDITGLRACWFDDEYIFQTGGTYVYDAKGVVFAEAYMGVPDGCTPEADLPANAQAWGSGTHSFSFTSGNDVEPDKITVTGTGAFIALPKAFNGGEYGAAPPATNGSVTYEVLNYINDGSSETLIITIDISAGEVGGAWWTFTLEAVQ